MGLFLNSIVPLEAYQSVVSGPYFVDKSALLGELLPALGREKKYFCITRPRRFGKTVMANMVAAYFGKAKAANKLFDSLDISAFEDYSAHVNRHDVIYIDFSRIPERCDDYNAYITRIIDGIKKDIISEFSGLGLDDNKSVWDLLQEIFEKNKTKFIFVMDEWDSVFHMPFITKENRQEYLLFLKNLLKDQAYVALAYMTGVLPITKYSSGSELNMFVEYDMATKKKFSEYFGFLNSEVDKVYQRYKAETKNPVITREDLEMWYDGYYTATEKHIYNPRSIVCALSDNELANYWTSSGPYDEIFYYIRNHIEAVREDLVLMVSGEGIEADIQNYAAVSMELETKDEIYSAMVVYGLLTYNDGKVFIPNREIMEQFQRLLMSKESLGYVYRLARESEQMLKATLSGNTKKWLKY